MEVYLPNQYYSPNKALSGGALFASFNSKDGCVYLKILKQIANNPDKKGNFDGKIPINIKLSQDEVADVIRAVRTNSVAAFYHKFDKTVTTGSFKYYEIPPQKEGDKPRSGYGFTVKKTIEGNNPVEVKVGFTLASAERLSLFLENALTHIFDAEYSQDLKDFKEYQKKNDKQPATDNNSEQTPKLLEEPVEETNDF